MVENSRDPPLNRVIEMKNRGINNNQIIETLTNENYSQQEIFDAVNQAEIKKGIEIPEDLRNLEMNVPPLSFSQAPQDLQFPEPPSPSQPSRAQPTFKDNIFSTETSSYNSSYPGDIEKIEEIAESIVQEKWEDLLRSVGDLSIWKEKVNTDILSIKQELLRTQERFENVQRILLGKVNEYGKDISYIGTEMKALEKVLEKIITPLSTNIKELQKITSDLKNTRKPK